MEEKSNIEIKQESGVTDNTENISYIINPTMILRWKRGNFIKEANKYEMKLEQMWVDENGKEEWIEILTVE
jgi:hypothetical protein